MRAKHPARLQPHEMYAVRKYPTRSDRHPMYMFGHFDLDGATPDLSRGLDEAILGIREDAQSTEFASHTHSLCHDAIAEQGSRAFMFGVNPEQPQAAPPGEPSFYFWAAGRC